MKFVICLFLLELKYLYYVHPGRSSKQAPQILLLGTHMEKQASNVQYRLLL
jgi:hypothetical protein